MVLERIGTKIYNAAIRKRNEYVAERNARKDIEREADKEAKAEALKEYKEQYTASRKAELIDRATDKAYYNAHRQTGVRRVASGAVSVGRVGRDILGSMPTLSNPNDPFHINSGPSRHKSTKHKRSSGDQIIVIKRGSQPNRSTHRKKKKRSSGGSFSSYLNGLA